MLIYCSMRLIMLIYVKSSILIYYIHNINLLLYCAHIIQFSSKYDIQDTEVQLLYCKTVIFVDQGIQLSFQYPARLVTLQLK